MTGDPTGRVGRRLEDLVDISREADYLVSKGKDAYLADTAEGRLLRAAGQNIVLRVATVAEKLPAEFRDQHPEAEWDKLRAMRNLTAHHYDKVNHDFIWVALANRVPGLIATLGLNRA